MNIGVASRLLSIAKQNKGTCSSGSCSCGTAPIKAAKPKKSFVASWATVDPNTLNGSEPVQLQNLVNGEWKGAKSNLDIPDPLNGETIFKMPNTTAEEADEFITSLNTCSKTGLHNPFKNPERYMMWGAVSRKMAEEMHKPEVLDFWAKLIQRVCPKHYAQALGEATVTRTFLENFSGDQVRFLARGFSNPGNHNGQHSNGHRWPYGPVAIVAPFNFPMEIPVLQLMGALYMGNKVMLKAASTTCAVMEQWLRMMHYCGAPKTDVDFICCGGKVMSEVMKKAQPRMLQFTGGSDVAEQLCEIVKGKIKMEDAGFDWKIMGPDVQYEDYVAWQADQDAYALSGQKCSAQSLVFVHENWKNAGLYEKLADLASQRNLKDLSIGPVLSMSTQAMLDHMNKILKISGTRVLFGGKPLEGHTIPKKYGAIQPTAVFVPLNEMLKDENFGLCTTEIFGPFQVMTEWKVGEEDLVIQACEKLKLHLTAAIMTNDVLLQQKFLGHTVNGTTYVGIRARTTGAPQNHWFGPCGDPRGAGIGTPEAIKLVWSSHREIIEDFGPIPTGWKRPPPT
jgi:1-pyrroline-5-carboxylate dehydrogenase